MLQCQATNTCHVIWHTRCSARGRVDTDRLRSKTDRRNAHAPVGGEVLAFARVQADAVVCHPRVRVRKAPPRNVGDICGPNEGPVFCGGGAIHSGAHNGRRCVQSHWDGESRKRLLSRLVLRTHNSVHERAIWHPLERRWAVRECNCLSKGKARGHTHHACPK